MARQKPVKPKAPTAHQIERVNEEISRNWTLNVEQALQTDIEWCLGSYRNDNNLQAFTLMANVPYSFFKFVSKDPKKCSRSSWWKDIEKAL